MQTSVWRTFACAVVSIALLGCGGKSAGTYPVKGVVTFKGQPLADAVVSFYPAQGRPAAGMTNAQGEFWLSTFQSKDGALPGSYNVGITEPTDIPPEGDYSIPEPKPPRFPAKYTDPKQSELTAEVKPGSENNFTFDLKE
ncbi:MAG TPA: carboxypeptidase regulatory-like domain-containing protein [Pirellulales bacterium]|nr:carboxypeptidase regulatory-like domain-containing protein [Pirellulales bacterium]